MAESVDTYVHWVNKAVEKLNKAWNQSEPNFNDVAFCMMQIEEAAEKGFNRAFNVAKEMERN